MISDSPTLVFHVLPPRPKQLAAMLLLFEVVTSPMCSAEGVLGPN